MKGIEVISVDKQAAAKAKVILSMFIYGTIGVFVRYIPLPSSLIAMVRGLLGAPFLLLVMLAQKKRLSGAAIRRNLPLLCVLGVLLGVNWILLFESYRFTTVATATLCYYTAPIFIVAASPFLLRERMTVRKLLCVFTALAGMVFVSGVAEKGIPSLSEIRGVLLALGAAVLYATVILLNKSIRNISGIHRTFLQFLAAILVLIPYVACTGGFHLAGMPALGWGCLLVVGLFHTGVTYCMYFSALKELSGQEASILSYIDPLVAVVISVLVLHEPITASQLAGGILILGFTLWNERASA